LTGDLRARRFAAGQFTNVRVIGHTDYDLIAEPAEGLQVESCKSGLARV